MCFRRPGEGKTEAEIITFKQLEAVYWIAELGSFSSAADKLNTTQSAISKRVQELERQFDIVIFDRSGRAPRMTAKGAEIVAHAQNLLQERDHFIERVSSSEVLISQFRLGVTELTAMTWLPKLVAGIRSAYPKVAIEPQVEPSALLFERLMADTFDLIVVPNVFNSPHCTVVPLRPIENAWMATPDLYTETAPLSLHDLSRFTMLVQGERSGTGIAYGRLLTQHEVVPTKTIVCENLIAQIGFTLSGLGVSYLPVPVTSTLLQRGQLKRLPMQEPLPEVQYAVLYRTDRSSSFKKAVADLAQQCCRYESFI